MAEESEESDSSGYAVAYSLQPATVFFVILNLKSFMEGYFFIFDRWARRAAIVRCAQPGRSDRYGLRSGDDAGVDGAAGPGNAAGQAVRGGLRAELAEALGQRAAALERVAGVRRDS